MVDEKISMFFFRCFIYAFQGAVNNYGAENKCGNYLNENYIQYTKYCRDVTANLVKQTKTKTIIFPINCVTFWYIRKCCYKKIFYFFCIYCLNFYFFHCFQIGCECRMINQEKKNKKPIKKSLKKELNIAASTILQGKKYVSNKMWKNK